MINKGFAVVRKLTLRGGQTELGALHPLVVAAPATAHSADALVGTPLSHPSFLKRR